MPLGFNYLINNLFLEHKNDVYQYRYGVTNIKNKFREFFDLLKTHYTSDTIVIWGTDIYVFVYYTSRFFIKTFTSPVHAK